MANKPVTDRTKYLYHVSHRRNFYPIMVHGLQVEFSNSAREKIGLVTERRLNWAAKHVMEKENCPFEDLIFIKVRVRRRKVRRNRMRGVWYSPTDICPCKIVWTKYAKEIDPDLLFKEGE